MSTPVRAGGCRAREPRSRRTGRPFTSGGRGAAVATAGLPERPAALDHRDRELRTRTGGVQHGASAQAERLLPGERLRVAREGRMDGWRGVGGGCRCRHILYAIAIGTTGSRRQAEGRVEHRAVRMRGRTWSPALGATRGSWMPDGTLRPGEGAPFHPSPRGERGGADADASTPSLRTSAAGPSRNPRISPGPSAHPASTGWFPANPRPRAFCPCASAACGESGRPRRSCGGATAECPRTPVRRPAPA